MFATTELHRLFDEWLESLEERALSALREGEAITTKELAASLGISEESATYLLARLKTQGKIDLRARPFSDSSDNRGGVLATDTHDRSRARPRLRRSRRRRRYRERGVLFHMGAQHSERLQQPILRTRHHDGSMDVGRGRPPERR